MPPGTRLGGYEIVGLLGSGGMGEVYRARDSRLGRDVALKILPDVAASAERRARFEQEARAVAALNHHRDEQPAVRFLERVQRDVSKMRSLKVISRTSVMQFKNRALGLRAMMSSVSPPLLQHLYVARSPRGLAWRHSSKAVCAGRGTACAS